MQRESAPGAIDGRRIFDEETREDAPCPRPGENDIFSRPGTPAALAVCISNLTHVADHITHIPLSLRPFNFEISELPADLIHSCFAYCKSQAGFKTQAVSYELQAKDIIGISVLLPDITPSSAEIENVAIAFWVPLSLNEPTLFRALMFSALSHRRACALPSRRW